jgi:hypothetical protein
MDADKVYPKQSLLFYLRFVVQGNKISTNTSPNMSWLATATDGLLGYVITSVHPSFDPY